MQGSSPRSKPRSSQPLPGDGEQEPLGQAAKPRGNSQLHRWEKGWKTNLGPVSSQHRAEGLESDVSNTPGTPTALASLQQVPVLSKGQDKINLGTCSISVRTAV